MTEVVLNRFMMDEEAFILAVQDYPNLYDLSHPKYHDNLCKSNSWMEIGQKMKISGAECQKKWRSLRECLRKSLRIRETKSGQGAKNIKPWRLERQMEFLKPFITIGRDRISNLDQSSEEESFQDPDHTEDTTEDPRTPAEDISLGSNSDIGSEVPDDHGTHSSKIKSTPIQILKKNGAALRQNSHSSNWKPQKPLTPTASVFKEYVEMKKAQHKERSIASLNNFVDPPQKSDHLTKYFQSIEETVRTLPPHLIVRLKTKISSLVHEAEEEALSSHFPTQTSRFSNSNWVLNTGHTSNFNQQIGASSASPEPPTYLCNYSSSSSSHPY